VTRRRLPRARSPHPARGAAALLLAIVPGVAGCGQPVTSTPRAASTADLPDGPEELERLVVTTVPSGLPRLPDQKLSPPAGEKSLDDVASYAPDPHQERGVLEDYGYRYGWERFWGHDGGPVTSVFVDQFETPDGAAEYAEDLASNDADAYSGMLRRRPAHLPDGCRTLTVAEPAEGDGLTGPAVFAWCGHGVFSVGVTSVASSVEAATEEVRGVVRAQLDRLPG
jgi:hypothetical protein